MGKKLTLILLLTVLLSGTSFASGFQLNEHGAKAMSLAGAFTGLANDASAVHFNSAALIYLSGTQISFGSTYIRPSGSFTGPSPSTTKSDLKHKYFTPINFYITHKINDDMAVGFGVNNPFGLGTEWEDNWVGRYNAVKTEIRVFNFTPVFSYKLSDQFSIGVGANIAYADVQISRALPAYVPATPPLFPTTIVLPDGKINLEGDDIAFGFNVAFLYRPNEQWSFGASYKHELAFDFEGDITSTTPNLTGYIPPAYIPTVEQNLRAAYPKGSATAPLTAPSVFTVGAAYKANDNLTLSSDLQYTMWSSFDKLIINFEDGTSSSSIRDYENSFIIRLGAEYKVNDSFSLRGGFLFDKNPIKDERIDFTLPDNDRFGYNIGFGYKITNSITFDFAYLLLVFQERTITNSEEKLANPFVAHPFNPGVAPAPLNGKYNPTANLIGANFSFNL